jgi:hypothetical protein
MLPQEASDRLVAAVLVTREDIARAKAYVLQAKESGTDALAELWLQEQGEKIPKEIDIDSSAAPEVLRLIARTCSLRLAMYQAVGELVAAGELIPAGQPETWQPHLTWRTQHGGGGLTLDRINCAFPAKIHQPPLASQPPTDPDIFLQGLDSKSLHPGIRAAIEQALGCFRRGLYLPATAMLAAAAEATWLECGFAIATKLSDAKLQVLLNDQYISISRKVTEIQKVLAQTNGGTLLKAAGESTAKIVDAVLWTTTLRDRRNALHWGKARSFIAEHSDTASLLLAAPLHLGTLESIRKVC